MSLDLKETLTHKYGPLPGYAWVGIGAGALVLVAKLKKPATASGPVTLTPASNGSILGSGDLGGGGGGLDPGAGLSGSDGLLGVLPTTGYTVAAAPAESQPLILTPTNVQTAPTPSLDPVAAANLVSAHLGSIAAGHATPEQAQAVAIVASQPPIPSLPVNAPVPGTESHPNAGTASAPILNTPPNSNVHRPGFQLT